MRVAVLGCGSIGRRHAANLAGLGIADLLVFDPDVCRAAAVAEAVGGTAVSTFDDVWAWQPRVAIVAAPASRHVVLAAEAARRRCDLFVEKPLAHTLDGVDALVAAAASAMLVTLVGCNMRFHPGPALVKQLIGEGVIGDVIAARLQTGSYLPGWRPEQEYRESCSASVAEGGALLECIHEIDLALWLFGPARLSAAVVRPATALGLDVDGLAELLLEHASGTVSSVHLNFVQRDYRRLCQVIGTAGSVYWDFTLPHVAVHRGERVDTHALPAGWQVNDMYIDEMRHFLDCVATRRATVAPLADGAAALRIALAAKAQATVPA